MPASVSRFRPGRPFLAVCGDPPRSIVAVDPITGDILEQLSGPFVSGDYWRRCLHSVWKVAVASRPTVVPTRQGE